MRTMSYALFLSGLLGIVFAFLVAQRWIFTYPEPSKAIFGISIGLGGAIMCFGFAYLYERVSYLNQKQRSIDERWDSFIQGEKAKEELNSIKKKNG